MKRWLLPTLFVLLLSACQETLEERCARETREFTEKNCPVVINRQADYQIVMDSMTFDAASHTIGNAYTVSGVLDDSLVIASGNARQLLLMELKNNTHLKLYKEAGYSFRYVYHSAKEKGTQLFEATFHCSDYQ